MVEIIVTRKRTKLRRDSDALSVTSNVLKYDVPSISVGAVSVKLPRITCAAGIGSIIDLLMHQGVIRTIPYRAISTVSFQCDEFKYE